jgi:hypothetical protein
MECNCNLYKRLDTCWHTGYKPTFQEREEIRRELPAFTRSRNRLMSKEELRAKGISLNSQEYSDYLRGKRIINVR